MYNFKAIMSINNISKYNSVIQNTLRYMSYIMWYGNICVSIGDNVVSTANITVMCYLYS